MSKGQEGVILWTPAVLLYNGFPVEGKKWWLCEQGNHAQEAQGHRIKKTYPGVLAQSYLFLYLFLSGVCQFIKSLS